MPDSQLPAAERAVQRKFSFGKRILLIVLLFSALLLVGDARRDKPDRNPGKAVLAGVRFIPLRSPQATGELRLRGMWEVASKEPRLGGVSALAAGPAGLTALTDSGVAIELPRPGTGTLARFRDLPAGPGSPWWKKFRDSEAMIADPHGRGWWVGYEFQHSLYLFGPGLRQAVRRIVFPPTRWSRNQGIEALAREADAILVIPETGEEVLRLKEGKWERFPLRGASGAPADAVSLPDGRTIVLLREIGLGGIRNALAWLRREPGGYRLRELGELRLGAFDNIEGIAAQPLPHGAVRLWMMTDNDFSKRRRTLLIAADLPAAGK